MLPGIDGPDEVQEDSACVVLPFPCRHRRFRQQRPNRSLLPCAWPGCSEGLPAESKYFKDRVEPPFTLTWQRRVTGGGDSPLLFLWLVVSPEPEAARSSEREEEGP